MAIDVTGGYSEESDYLLLERPTNLEMRESVSMWISDREGRFGFPRMAVEAVAADWENRGIEANVTFPSGRVLSGAGGFGAQPVKQMDGRSVSLGGGPLRFEVKEPLRHWIMNFDGTMYDRNVADQVRGLDGGEPRRVVIEIDARMAAPPWNPGERAERAGNRGAALAVGGVGGQRHEQLFTCVGSLSIEGEPTQYFEGTGLRIRRTGLRSLSEFVGHCWLSALFRSGKAFGILAFPPRIFGEEPSFSEAFIFDGSKKQYGKVREAPWLTHFDPHGGECNLSIELEDGEIVNIEGVTHDSLFLPADRPMHGDWSLDAPLPMPFHQGGALYRWDGEETYGMIERSLPRDRWKDA